MRLAVCALLLAGCYDFSRFDHLPDGLTTPAGDLGSSNVVLVSERFDGPIDWTSWDAGSAGQDVFEFDPNTSNDGNGSMRIAVDALSAIGVGVVSWRGSTLPSTPGSRHLRFWAAYDSDLSGTTFMGILRTDSTGAAVGLTPAQANNPSNGASVILNQLQPKSVAAGITVQDQVFHCYELGVELLSDGAHWKIDLRVDDQLESGTINPSMIDEQVAQLYVGFGTDSTPPLGPTAAWIDDVVMTSGPDVIGCM